ncbi:hypothetical protein [Desulfotomaculum sp. 1211_IL3151]|uniref:hypothetical protein n=1 Tax=Desulfotomaculum sp. 1211_IL3151 TaxID=3084055 RepID=UPI002FD9F865
MSLKYQERPERNIEKELERLNNLYGRMFRQSIRSNDEVKELKEAIQNLDKKLERKFDAIDNKFRGLFFFIGGGLISSIWAIITLL